MSFGRSLLLALFVATIPAIYSQAQAPYAPTPGFSPASPSVPLAAAPSMLGAPGGHWVMPAAYAPPNGPPPGMMPPGAFPQGPPPGMQGPPPGMLPPGAFPQGPLPGMQGMPSYFDPSVAPAGYGPPGEMPGNDGGRCGEGYSDSLEEFDVGVGSMLFPENCSAPRWYNVDIQFMLLFREQTAGSQVFSTTGINGPAALSADELDFHEGPGFRVGWQTVIGPGDALEASYFGTMFYDDTVEATSGTNNLFSIFSNFGQTPFGGFTDADGASLHRLHYDSDLHSGEINYRRKWISPNARIQHSILLGVRFIRLDERFQFTGQTPLGNFDYNVKTENNDLGFQLGGDLYVQATRRIMFGGEAKAGVYGNDANQITSFAATTIVPTLEENVHRTAIAFVAEANVVTLIRINEHFTFKAGYEMLFLDRLALAPNNFNASPPQLGGRVPFIHVEGEAFYHGLVGGMEWTW